MKFPAWLWIFLDLLLLATYAYMLCTGASDHAGRLGILLLAIGLIGLATAGGGAALIILAIPPAGAGALALRRLAAVRTTAVSVALAYGAFALYVATAPLRGLTTPDGSNPAGPDFALLVIGAVFGLAAVLLIVGKPAGQLPGRGPSRA